MLITSWNVNGIRASYPKGLSEYVKIEKPDFLCLQETKAHIEQVSPEMQSLSFKNYLWSSAQKKGYSGVATFTNDTSTNHTIESDLREYNSEGRVVISEHANFKLYNIYFPNGGAREERHFFKQKFLKELNVHLKPLVASGQKIIVVGDYNVAHTEVDVYDPVRLSSESGFLPEERLWFTEFLALGFIDTFRHLNPNVKEKYTWWSYRELARISNRGWRIDYICMTKNLLPALQDARIRDDLTGSDHCPIEVRLSF